MFEPRSRDPADALAERDAVVRAFAGAHQSPTARHCASSPGTTCRSPPPPASPARPASPSRCASRAPAAAWPPRSRSPTRPSPPRPRPPLRSGARHDPRRPRPPALARPRCRISILPARRSCSRGCVERARRRDRPRAGRPLHRRLPLRIAIGAVAAIALLAGVSAGLGGDGSPDLASRAYAQTQAAASEILHVVQRSRQEFPPRSRRGSRTRPAPSRAGCTATRRTRSSRAGGPDGRMTFTSDQLLGADGVIRNHLSDTGETQTVRPSDGAEAREIIANSRRDFVADFRARYERGVLDDDGTTTFAGPSRAPLRRRRRSRSIAGQREEFYLDAETGSAAGFDLQGRDVATARRRRQVRKNRELPKRDPAGGWHDASRSSSSASSGCRRRRPTSRRSASAETPRPRLRSIHRGRGRRRPFSTRHAIAGRR